VKIVVLMTEEIVYKNLNNQALNLTRLTIMSRVQYPKPISSTTFPNLDKIIALLFVMFHTNNTSHHVIKEDKKY
jgi:hypothetical protein